MGITNNTLSLSFKTLFLNLLAATVVLSPLTALKPASSESITVDNLKADLIAQAGVEVPIDPVELGNTVNDAVKTSRNRSGFVKGVMQSAYYNVGNKKYNVMVFNLSVDHEARLNGVKAFKRASYDGVTYGIWIFENGTFINKGDGGYINWAFKGDWNRTGHQGHTVTFR